MFYSSMYFSKHVFQKIASNVSNNTTNYCLSRVQWILDHNICYNISKKNKHAIIILCYFSNENAPDGWRKPVDTRACPFQFRRCRLHHPVYVVSFINITLKNRSYASNQWRTQDFISVGDVVQILRLLSTNRNLLQLLFGHFF